MYEPYCPNRRQSDNERKFLPLQSLSSRFFVIENKNLEFFFMAFFSNSLTTSSKMKLPPKMAEYFHTRVFLLFLFHFASEK